MKCSSKIQAERVAAAGAAKMAAQGYTVKQSAANPHVFRVEKADGSFYWVQVEGPGTARRCGCEFFRANRQFGCCKHLAFVDAEIEARRYCAAKGLPVEPMPLYQRPRATFEGFATVAR